MSANPELVKQRNISEDNVNRINNLHRELEACLNETDEYLKETSRELMYNWFEAIEFTLQRYWGFTEDKAYHTWVHRLTERYRELDYLGAVYKCNKSGEQRIVTKQDLKDNLFIVGNGFLDLAGYNVRTIGLERVK